MDSRFVPKGHSLALWSAFLLYSAAVLGWTHIDSAELAGSADTPAVEASVRDSGQAPVIGELSEDRVDAGVCEPGLLYPLPPLVTAGLDDRRIPLPAAR